MSQVQRDLQTKLTYFTVCHYNTDNPHVHIVLRGKKNEEPTLSSAVITSAGACGCGQKSSRLGTRLPLRKRCYGERGTRFGRGTTYCMGPRHRGSAKESGSRVYRLSDDKESRKATQTAKRLTFLVGLGFAKEVAPNQFLVQERFLSDLREISVRRDIIKSLTRVAGAAWWLAHVATGSMLRGWPSSMTTP